MSRLDCPWEETSFLMQGFMVESQEDIDALIKQCQFVYIETRRSRAPIKASQASERRIKQQGLFARKSSIEASGKLPICATDASYKPIRGKTTYINKINVEREFEQAKGCYQFAKQTSKSILAGIRIGRTLDLDECKLAVSQVVDSIIRNSNAMVWLSKIRNQDEYTAEHSLNVCILSVSFARHLQLEPQEIEKIGLCALLHDVGKAKIPLSVLNKPGRLTEEEFQLMRQHSLYGRDLLMSTSGIDMAAIDVAYSHHERIDGKGYPRQLESHQLAFITRLISIVDTYDAITSNRCYDQGRSSTEALDIIYKNKGLQFDEELAIEFIKCIGIYPPGSIVEMTNGEVGIVIASNKESKLKPRLILVLDAEKQKRFERVLDLTKQPLDEDKTLYKIAKELPNKMYGVNLKDYLKKGLVIETVGG